jgi:hypothetical protein
MLPGDPNRVFNTFTESAGHNRPTPLAAPEHDPTLLKPQNGNPFSSE